MTRNKALIGLIVVIVVALGIVAITERRSEVGVIRIGSILVLSGDYKSLGEQIRDGQLLAIADLNAVPGRQSKLELAVYDSQGEKELALEKVKTLKRDGVNFIGEIFGSGPALHTIPFISEQNMLFVSGVDTGPDLTTQGGKNFFRIIPSDAAASQQLAQWSKDLELHRAAVVYLNDTWGTGLKKELDRVYPPTGGEIVAAVDTGQGQDIFRPVVAGLKAKKPDVVFLFIHPKEAALLVREARSQGLTSRFMGTDNLTGSEFSEVGRDGIAGVMYVAPKQPPQTEQGVRFRTAYERKVGAGKEPPLFTVMAYDAMHVLVKAIDESGANVSQAIKILENMNYSGATGQITFDQNHDLVVRDYQRKIYVSTDGRVVAQDYSVSSAK